MLFALPILPFHLFFSTETVPSGNRNGSQPGNRAGVESSLSVPATNSKEFHLN